MASLKSFDLFPKLNSESQRTTEEGGLITIIGIIIALVLFISETIRASNVSSIERLEMFQETSANLSVHVELSFFHLRCEELTFEVSATSRNDAEKASAGWSIRTINKTPSLDKEGCDVQAVVDIDRYQSGEMHVSLSPHVFASGQIGITIEEYFKYNSSHALRSIAVGEANADLSSLQVRTFINKYVPERGTGRFVYDFTVVPQAFRRGKEEVLSFLTQCREQDVITHDGNEAMFALQRLGLPGVFMTVQLSTMMILKVETRVSWGEYFISVLGIIAGTSATVAFIDSLLHETFWKAKLD